MKYPTLSVEDCCRLNDKRYWGDHYEVRTVSEIRGEGPKVNLHPLEQTAPRMLALTEDSSRDPDQTEGEAAVLLYPSLAAMDPVILEDPGFWRYLFIGIRKLNDFVRWRHKKNFMRARTENDYIGHRVYFDATQPHECVLTRMYLRVRSLGGSDYGDLSFASSEATDFWRSHITRVRTSKSSAVVRAFARMQRDERLTTKPLREFAKHLNGLRSNVVLHDYDDAEADALINEIRAVLDGSN